MTDIVGYRSSFYWTFRYWATAYFATHPSLVTEISYLIIRASIELRQAAVSGVNIRPEAEKSLLNALARIMTIFSRSIVSVLGPGADMASQGPGVVYESLGPGGTMDIMSPGISSSVGGSGAIMGGFNGAAGISVRKPSASWEVIV